MSLCVRTLCCISNIILELVVCTQVNINQHLKNLFFWPNLFKDISIYIFLSFMDLILWTFPIIKVLGFLWCWKIHIAKQ